MNINAQEKQLLKRLDYPYIWSTRQFDNWDNKTNFIYDINDFDLLLKKVNKYNSKLFNYTLNRWFNFWSASCIEHIFSSHKIVKKETDIYNRYIDFYIGDTPFDHKTSVYPKYFEYDIDDVKNNKELLIKWLYKNQSQQKRKHLKNRLFVIVYDKNTKEHWKIKAHISQFKNAIFKYLDDFDKSKLCKIKLENNTVYSDIIWIVKE